MDSITTGKRKIEVTSPDSPLPAEKRIVSNMAITNASLQDALAPLLEPLAKSEDLDKILKQIQDLMSANQMLTERVEFLTQRCEKLEEQVSTMYNWRTERNIIVRMNRGASTEEEKRRVLQVCTNLTDDAEILNINEIKPITTKNGNQCMLIASFSDTNKVHRVLRNAKKLHGTDVSLSKDYPKDTRAKRQQLLKVRRHIINASGAKVILRDDILLEGDTKFKWSLTDGLYLASQGVLREVLAKYCLTPEGLDNLLKPRGITENRQVEQQRNRKLPVMGNGEQSVITSYMKTNKINQ